jgi:hypothetical protein
VISARACGGIDRFLVEEAPDDDPAPVLARLGVSPDQLIRNALAVRAEPDVVDPAKAIEVIGANWWGHGVPRL